MRFGYEADYIAKQQSRGSKGQQKGILKNKKAATEQMNITTANGATSENPPAANAQTTGNEQPAQQPAQPQDTSQANDDTLGRQERLMEAINANLQQQVDIGEIHMAQRRNIQEAVNQLPQFHVTEGGHIPSVSSTGGRPEVNLPVNTTQQPNSTRTMDPNASANAKQKQKRKCGRCTRNFICRNCCKECNAKRKIYCRQHCMSGCTDRNTCRTHR